MSNVVFKKQIIWLDRINGKRIMTPEERKERQRERARERNRRKKEQLALLKGTEGVPVVLPKVSID